MTRNEAVQALSHWDRQGRCVFTIQDLARMFPHDSSGALDKGIRRLVRAGLLQRVGRGVYVNANAMSRGKYLLERIAMTLRRGEYSYVSLESMLSELSVISQIPLDRLTVITTGRRGEYKTPFGVIEFTHTKRPVSDILKYSFHVADRPMRITTAETAWRDLKRVGRNVHLVDQEALVENG